MNGRFFGKRNIRNNDSTRGGWVSTGVKRRTRTRTALICLLIFGFILSLFLGVTVFSGKRSAVENQITASAAVADDWKTAIDSATATTASTFKLTSGWTATANANGFGTVSGYYTSGALYVPANKKVVIDLNGQTLNRNLSNSATSNGYVIYVAGDLTITNSSTTTGYVRNGYSSTSYTAGGIYVASGGSLTIEDRVSI